VRGSQLNIGKRRAFPFCNLNFLIYFFSFCAPHGENNSIRKLLTLYTPPRCHATHTYLCLIFSHQWFALFDYLTTTHVSSRFEGERPDLFYGTKNNNSWVTIMRNVMKSRQNLVTHNTSHIRTSKMMTIKFWVYPRRLLPHIFLIINFYHFLFKLPSIFHFISHLPKKNVDKEKKISTHAL
jgi:hypothetical protein